MEKGQQVSMRQGEGSESNTVLIGIAEEKNEQGAKQRPGREKQTMGTKMRV